MKITKILIIIFVSFLLYNCAEKTIYSGKIINNNNFTYSHITNKNQLIDELGNANYIDPIENKYFYIHEKTVEKNFFDKELMERNIVVASFDLEGNIISIEKYNLDDQKIVKINQNKTENSIIQRGLIEKIFGGVGMKPATTATPE